MHAATRLVLSQNPKFLTSGAVFPFRKLNQIKSNQIKSNQNQIKSNQIKIKIKIKPKKL